MDLNRRRNQEKKRKRDEEGGRACSIYSSAT
jgi:hypothetical protein